MDQLTLISISLVLCVTVVSSCLVIQYKMTALHYASRNGHTEVVKVLLAAGANINYRDSVK